MKIKKTMALKLVEKVNKMMERPTRTPKQHKMLSGRLLKILRLFKPDDAISFAKLFRRISNR